MYSGSTVALPPPCVRAADALLPMTATERSAEASQGSSPWFSNSTVPSIAASRVNAMPSSTHTGAVGSDPSSAPTRWARVRMRSTFRSINVSSISPERTASTSASPQGPSGPGMTRSWEALALSRLRTAVQSLMTTPSKPHSLFSGVSSSSFSVAVTPLTAL